MSCTEAINKEGFCFYVNMRVSQRYCTNNCHLRNVVKPKIIIKKTGCQQTDNAKMPTEFPPLSKMVSNFLGSMKRWVKEGMPVRDDEEIGQIMAICRECESARPTWAGLACTVCGCKLSAAIAVATKHCDKGKW